MTYLMFAKYRAFLFADDSNIFISDADPYELECKLNNELEIFLCG